MSKEIIIDGVDVAGCKNFISVYTEDEDIEINNCCTLTYTPCQFEKKDCYYKQLKRLQAENKQLKKEIWQLQHRQMWDKEATLQAELLIKENERLKEEITTLECKLDAKKPSMIIPKPKQLAVPIKEVETYLKAFEEIRNYLNTLSSVDSDFPNTETYLRVQDKINEVLKEGE